MAGRSVRLFLVDGTPQGMRTAEVGAWNGLALVCPRTDLVKLGKRDAEGGNRDAVRGPGVYFLLASSESLPSRLRVYVGEADDVWARLQFHDSKTEFWTSVIAFVSKDKSLNKAHVRWLEAKLYREISKARRADIENDNAPKVGHLAETDAADMETFLENMRLLLPTLGADVLRPSMESAPGGAGLALELKWEEARAQCHVRDGQFVVKKGSTARANVVASLSKGYRELRNTLRATGVLADAGDGLLKFTIDYPFDSPSAAADVVTGCSVNGRLQWKVKGQGTTYKDWHEEQVGTSNGSN